MMRTDEPATGSPLPGVGDPEVEYRAAVEQGARALAARAAGRSDAIPREHRRAIRALESEILRPGRNGDLKPVLRAAAKLLPEPGYAIPSAPPTAAAAGPLTFHSPHLSFIGLQAP